MTIALECDFRLSKAVWFKFPYALSSTFEQSRISYPAIKAERELRDRILHYMMCYYYMVYYLYCIYVYLSSLS